MEAQKTNMEALVKKLKEVKGKKLKEAKGKTNHSAEI
jgi:hypothetical protein